MYLRSSASMKAWGKAQHNLLEQFGDEWRTEEDRRELPWALNVGLVSSTLKTSAVSQRFDKNDVMTQDRRHGNAFRAHRSSNYEHRESVS